MFDRAAPPNLQAAAHSPPVAAMSVPQAPAAPPSAAQGAGPPWGTGPGPSADSVAPLVSHWSEPGSQSAPWAPVQAAAQRGTRSNGGPLPHLAAIQRSFGRHDVSQVSAHTGAEAAAAATAMGAEAFATGSQVGFAGPPSLHTAAHEAAHIVQQRGGVQLKGGVGQTGDAYEQHADRVADQVVRGQSSEALLDEFAGGGQASSQAAVQRKVTIGKAGGKIEKQWETEGDCLRFELEFASQFSELSNPKDWAKINFFIKRGEHNFDSEQQMIATLRHKLGLGPKPAASAGRTIEPAAQSRVDSLINPLEDETVNSKQRTMAKHRAERDALRKIVELGAALPQGKVVAKAQGELGGGTGNGSGMDADAQRRLANTCEWVKSGRIKLYAVTPTHDYAARLERHGMNYHRDQAWFPKATGRGCRGHIYDDLVEYDPLDLSDPNVDLQAGGQGGGGWNLPGVIAVVNAQSKDVEKVWQTLRHEAQHESDQHFDKEDAFVQGSWQWNLEQYKTEYRAHNYERGIGRDWDLMSHQRRVGALGYSWTEKQWAIFHHIFKEYQHTKDGWGESENRPLGKGVPKPPQHGQPEPQSRLEDRQRFQQEVVAYADPDSEGFNKFNSIRVDEFYRALKAIPPGTEDVNAPEVQTLIRVSFTASGTKLLGCDAQYILGEAPDFTKKMKDHLAGAALAGIRDHLARAE